MKFFGFFFFFCATQINKILSDLRATQHSLEEDIIYKENTLGIDTICHRLTNYSRGINYYGGIEKYDPTVSTIEMWMQASSGRINKYRFSSFFLFVKKRNR